MKVKNSLKFLVVLSLLAFSTAVIAEPASSFYVLVEKQASNYFFSVQGENVTSTRVEVLGLNGRPLFDSGWILGQTVAWPLVTLNGQPAANGVYLYAISVRDQQGKEQRKLGKLAIVHGLEAMLGTPDISEISRIEPSALPAGVKWQEKLGKDSVDNFRIQRRPGNGQPFQDLLTLDNAGKLSVAQLCLSGVCFASWPSGGGGTFTLADGSVTLAKLVNQSCTAGNAIQGWTNGTLNCVSIGGGGGGGSAWLLTGNAGTNPSTNFLGTTDNVALAFRTNNQEQMRINETGSVGIGTTVFPNGLGRVLSVASTVLDGGGVTVGGSGASEVLYLYANTSLNYGGIQVKRPTVAFDNLVLQEQGGNVGIGIRSPEERLHVKGNIALPRGNKVIFGDLGVGTSEWIQNASTGFGLSFFGSGSERMRITNTGNIGIGTTNPGSSLEVAGGIRARGGAPGANGVNNNGYAFSGNNGDTDSGMFSSADGQLEFYTNAVEKIRITSAGNVGIGTGNPTERLRVRGPDTLGTTAAFAVVNFDSTSALIAFDDGTVGIGALSGTSATHACLRSVSGNLLFANCGSAGEYVPTVDNGSGYPETGDLVSIRPADKNPYGDNHGPFVVAKTSKPCDNDLLGFILKPELGSDGPKLNEHYRGLAIFGYFPAKVTMENGTIKRGDPITSSSKPGYGMKATQACKIIGYALEDADREGTIQVFAHLSEYAAPEVTALRAQVQALERSKTSEMEELRQRLATLEKLVEALSKK